MKTRFAPSPTGYLHIGHAYAAWQVWDDAQSNPDNFILRIEDIDQTRCKPEFEQAIIDDLNWLGITWKTPIRRQSEYLNDYKDTLEKLSAMDLLYPCFCTRKEIDQESETSIYPGTCKNLSKQEQQDKIDSHTPYALRLDLEKSLTRIPEHQLIWYDKTLGKQYPKHEQMINECGDVILGRKDTPVSYHLCVTHDDNLQNIDLVTRGQDLLFATPIHRLLQELLGYNTPQYHHHPLLTTPQGKKFAKRDKSLTLRSLRNKGLACEQLRHIIMHGNINDLLI